MKLVQLSFFRIIMCKGIILQLNWDDVKAEMVQQKGIPEKAADLVSEYIVYQGTQSNTTFL